MNSVGPCPHCGTRLRPRVLDGLCPRCLTRCSLDFNRVVAIGDSPVADRLRLTPLRAHLRLHFADYELEGEIARGGIGVVYRARQISLNRLVALKLLLSGQFADPDQVRRFYAEAEAVARLDHPGIVPIYEVGEFEGRHFFSMKLIEGRSLAGAMSEFELGATRRQVGRERQSPAAALRRRQRELARFLADIARAIHYAHQRGVLHRDLKPANVLLDAAGQPHVTDFGLARFIGEDRRLTNPGLVVGTPSYMPPEQTDDPHNVTVAADVYSLGAIGYELVTGQPPFEAGSAMETLIQLREQEPTRPRDLEPEISRDLETILLKCLSKSPSSRFGSALALAEDLERFIAHEPIHARPVRLPERAWQWARRHPAVATLSTSLALLILAVAFVAPVVAVILERDRGRAEAAGRQALKDLRDATLARARAERLSRDIGQRESGLQAVTEAARINPDSTVLTEAIAQLVRFDTAPDINSRPRAGPDLPVAMSPAFTVSFLAQDDGSVCGIDPVHGKELWRWNGMTASSGPATELYPSPDDQHLVIVGRGELELLHLPSLSSVARLLIIDFLRFGPDGRWFLLLDRERRVQRYETATGRHLGTIPGDALAHGDIAVAPRAQFPWLAVLKGSSVDFLDWQEDRIVASLEQPIPCHDLVWSGEWLAAGSDSGAIVVWHLPSRRHAILNGHRASVRNLQFIPDTRYLLAISVDGQHSCWDVASGDRLLTGTEFLPLQVSADGLKLLYGTPTTWGWTEFLHPASRHRISCRDTGTEEVRHLDFDGDGRWLLVAKQAGVHLVDRIHGIRTSFLPALGTVVAAFVPGTNQVVVQHRQAIQWHTYDPDAGLLTQKPFRRIDSADHSWLDRGAFDASHSHLLIPQEGGILQMIGLADGALVWSQKREALVQAVQAEILGDDVVFWSARDRQVRRLNLAEDKSNGAVKVLRKTGASPRFSPDGRMLLLSGLMSHELFAVDKWIAVREESVRGRLSGEFAPGAWTADSRFVALVVDQDQISLRRIADWEEVGRLTTPQPNAYTSLCFSSGGRWLAAGTDHGSVELWDLATLRTEVAQMNLTFNWPASDREDELPATVSAPSSLPGPAIPLLPRPLPSIAPRQPDASVAQIDLTGFYNTFLGEISPGHPDPEASFKELPLGLLSSQGITFEIRGMILLAGERLRRHRPDLPVAVTNIPIGQRVSSFHLLGAVTYAPPSVPRRLEVARVLVRYRDGSVHPIPLRLGEEIEDHWSRPRSPAIARRSSVAWRGVGTSVEGASSWAQLLHLRLENPFPAREVASLDLISSLQIPAPFFVALTVE